MELIILFISHVVVFLIGYATRHKQARKIEKKLWDKVIEERNECRRYLGEIGVLEMEKSALEELLDNSEVKQTAIL